MDIVVARYNEDLDWLKDFTDHSLYVYDKGGNANQYAYPLPNIGREAHTYIYHILQKYDRLPDRTIFLQGDPIDTKCFKPAQPQGWLNKPLLDIVNFDPSLEFEPLTRLFQCNYDGGPNQPGLRLREDVFDKFFVDTPPEPIEFPIGAQFIVSRKAIQYRSKAFYKALLDEFETSQLLPWQLERVWPYVFSNVYKTSI